MRLTLRKRLKPFQSLYELAEALDLTIPELKRKIHSLEEADELTLSNLAGEARPVQVEEATFKMFHEAGRCLVCGNPMVPPARKDIGWGEFKQCRTCDFSAHEMANYNTRRRAAMEQLSSLITQSRKTAQVLRARAEHSESLRG